MVTVSPNLIKRQKQHFNVLASLGEAADSHQLLSDHPLLEV